jgi:hypothetical protein
MPDLNEGRVAKVSKGEITLDLPSGATAEVGERFSIISDSGKQIAQVKVIRSDATGIVARQFQSFVSDDVLRAVAAGVGAVIGSLAFEPVPGAMVGAALGSVLGQRQRAAISPGMKVIPTLEIERQHGELSGS